MPGCPPGLARCARGGPRFFEVERARAAPRQPVRSIASALWRRHPRQGDIAAGAGEPACGGALRGLRERLLEHSPLTGSLYFSRNNAPAVPSPVRPSAAAEEAVRLRTAPPPSAGRRGQRAGSFSTIGRAHWARPRGAPSFWKHRPARPVALSVARLAAGLQHRERLAYRLCRWPGARGRDRRGIVNWRPLPSLPPRRFVRDGAQASRGMPAALPSLAAARETAR